jgi:hypothetical protein
MTIWSSAFTTRTANPDDDWVEGNGQLASIIQARVELAAGDLRLLYLGWLLAIQLGEVDDEEAEPPVPAGLDDLSAPLQAIAEFLDIDEDLLAVAAETSPGIMVEENDGLTEWIAAMPVTEKDALLTMVANGEGAQVQWQLLRCFRRNAGGEAPSRGPVIASRTVAELLDAAEDHRAARELAAELRRREEEAREAAAKAAAYAKRLDGLAPRTEGAWKKVAELIETRSPREYDVAVSLLRDLHALAERQGDAARFTERFLTLRARHARKPSLQERFDKASLPRPATR